jgi:hypothetical protein
MQDLVLLSKVAIWGATFLSRFRHSSLLWSSDDIEARKIWSFVLQGAHICARLLSILGARWCARAIARLKRQALLLTAIWCGSSFIFSKWYVWHLIWLSTWHHQNGTVWHRSLLQAALLPGRSGCSRAIFLWQGLRRPTAYVCRALQWRRAANGLGNSTPRV